MRLTPCNLGHQHWHVEQSRNDSCGAACVAMVVKELNSKDVPFTFEADALKVKTAKAGLNVADLVNLLTKNGIQAEHVNLDGDVGAAVRSTSNGRHTEFPIFLQMFGKSAGGNDLSHWILLYGRKRNLVYDDQFCVLDPACSTGTVSLQTIAKTGVVSIKTVDGIVLVPTRHCIRILARGRA
ncbi:MAG: hypothetical protein JO332_15490 [Planctomycetaceae bacterium]|nr:hypothetical protein [Planctomycetaceae bacterium]